MYHRIVLRTQRSSCAYVGLFPFGWCSQIEAKKSFAPVSTLKILESAYIYICVVFFPWWIGQPTLQCWLPRRKLPALMGFSALSRFTLIRKDSLCWWWKSAHMQSCRSLRLCVYVFFPKVYISWLETIAYHEIVRHFMVWNDMIYVYVYIYIFIRCHAVVKWNGLMRCKISEPVARWRAVSSLRS